MDTLKLRVAIESLRQSKSGAIYAQVFFRVGAEDFPGPGWSDLAVAFLLAWIAAIVRLWGSRVATERVRFMDGPYWADLARSRKDSDTVSVDLILDRLTGPITKHSVTVDLRRLLSEAVELGQEVLTACRKDGWRNSDIDDLAEIITTASRLAKPHVS